MQKKRPIGQRCVLSVLRYAMVVAAEAAVAEGAALVVAAVIVVAAVVVLLVVEESYGTILGLEIARFCRLTMVKKKMRRIIMHNLCLIH